MCELDCALLSIYCCVQQQVFPKIFTVLPNYKDTMGSKETVSEEDLKGCENLRRLQTLNPFVAGKIL